MRSSPIIFISSDSLHARLFLYNRLYFFFVIVSLVIISCENFHIYLKIDISTFYISHYGVCGLCDSVAVFFLLLYVALIDPETEVNLL